MVGLITHRRINLPVVNLTIPKEYIIDILNHVNLIRNGFSE
jgi:hypothetical protein